MKAFRLMWENICGPTKKTIHIQDTRWGFYYPADLAPRMNMWNSEYVSSLYVIPLGQAENFQQIFVQVLIGIAYLNIPSSKRYTWKQSFILAEMAFLGFCPPHAHTNLTKMQDSPPIHHYSLFILSFLLYHMPFIFSFLFFFISFSVLFSFLFSVIIFIFFLFFITLIPPTHTLFFSHSKSHKRKYKGIYNDFFSFGTWNVIKTEIELFLHLQPPPPISLTISPSHPPTLYLSSISGVSRAQIVFPHTTSFINRMMLQWIIKIWLIAWSVSACACHGASGDECEWV